MNTKEINIAFCFDENLWMQAGVTITSLLETSKNTTKYSIYCLISNSINTTIQNILESNLKKYSSFNSIKFINVENKLTNIKSKQYKPMYYRLLLPQVLPPSIDKVIYTDVDLIFNDDMQDLYSIDLTNYYIAATKDGYKGNDQHSLWKKYKICSIAKKEQYINSGVLLLNLKNIRNNKIYVCWLKLAERESFPFHDQDIINITCKDKIIFLPEGYNFSYDNAKIIHFSCGGKKPWSMHSENLKFAELWWFYAHKTPFTSFFLANYYKSNINSLSKVLPKWIGRFICWFVLNKETRHKFFNKYVKI
ncbi:MAG: glycosyltransferase family 8 protein [Endomicrobium sp.]|jgi:lipopolysaccharide biosynthesis glycosyltransferase|nr:glycosyltransferase family 8 protein [Endomicrobium sp.]